MPWNKTDRSFKTLINKRVTDSDAKFYFNEKGDFTINTHQLELWVDAIPSTAPGTTTDIVEYHNTLTLVEDTSVPNKQAWFATSNASTVPAQTDETSRLKNWVSDKYGSTYEIVLYDTSNVQIPPSDGCGWFFDYQTGILTFASTTTTTGGGGSLSSRAPFKIKGYRYIGRTGLDGNIIKNEVRVATTPATSFAGWSYSSELIDTGVTSVSLTIDGISLNTTEGLTGDRILIKNWSTLANNGIYYVERAGDGASDTWRFRRAPDFNDTQDIFPGTMVFVRSGTVNARTVWSMSNASFTTLDAGGATGEITFAQFITATTRWSALTAPDANLSLSMSTYTTTFNWATGTSTNNLFSLTTDASANGTGALLNLATGTSSTVLPLLVKAGGTTALTVNASAQVLVGTLTNGRVTYAGASGLLQDSANMTFDGNRLSLATTGNTGGLLIGGDAQIYRDAADTLRTPDSLRVDVGFGLGDAPPASTAGKGLVTGSTTSDTVNYNTLYVNATHSSTTNPTTARVWGLRFVVAQGSSGVYTDAQGATGIEGLAEYTGSGSAAGVTGAVIYSRSNTASASTLTRATGILISMGDGQAIVPATSGIITNLRPLDIAWNTPVSTTGQSRMAIRIQAGPAQSAGSTVGGIWFYSDSGTMSDGVIWGLSADTNLYRSAANTLKTDDSFVVGTNLSVLNAGTFSLYESGSVNFSSFAAGTQANDIRYTLPTSQPSTNQILTASAVSGSGPYDVTLSWVTPATSGITIGDGITGSTVGSVLFVGAGSTLAQDNSNFFWDDTNNYLGLGTAAAPAARLHIAGNQTAVAWTTNGILLRIGTATLTDSSSTGTVAAVAANAIQTPTLAASNSTTYTDAATLYISANPTAGTNVSITNGYALWVDSGATRLDGNLIVGSLTSTRIPYASTGGLLVDSSNMTFDGNRIALATTGNTGGLLIGGDANLYRSATDTLKTDDSFVVGVNLSVLNAGTFSLYESGSVNFSSFAAGTQANDLRYTLPTSQPSTNQVLTATSVSGTGPYDITLGWVTNSASITIGDTVNSGTAGSVLFVGTGPVLAQDNANLYWDDTNNYFGVGTTASPGARVHIAGNQSASAWGVNGILLRVATATLTDTTSSGTVTNAMASSVAAPTFAASSSTTYTHAASFYLAGGPVAGSNVAITNSYALYVGAGNTRFDDSVSIGIAPTSARLALGGSLSASAWGSNGIAFRTVATTYTDTTSSGTVSAAVASSFNTPTFAASSTTTYTNAANVYISNAPSAGTNVTITNAYALWVNTGVSRFDDGLQARNLTSTRITYAGTNGLLQDSANMTFDGNRISLATTGNTGGLLIGTDANLYRSAADTLRTDDSFIVGVNLTVNSLTSTRVPFASTNGLLVDSPNFTFTTIGGQLGLAATGSGGGILIGGDTQLYRSAADILRTPDSLTVDVNLTVSGTASIGAAGGTTGTINLLGSTSGTVSVLVQAAAGTYNFNLPTTAGSSGHVLTSAGGGASAMTWTDPATLAVRWNSIANPTGNQSLTMSTHTTTWNWATGTSTSNLFNLTTDASANGTGALLRVATGTSSTVVPMLIVAAGTTALTVNASAQVLVNSLTSTRITYAGTNGLLQDSANMTFDGNRISLATTGNTGGLLIGGDANLYRSAADVLKTDDSFVVGTNLSVLNAGTFSLYESGSVNFSSFAAGTQAADLRYTLPTSQPSTNQVLTASSITGAGPYDITLTWAAPTASISIGSAITSGTAGSVLFVGAGDVLAQDNSNFFWDDTNNYLGLGTAATPAARLHVAGNQTAAAWTTNGVLLRIGTATLTDSSSTGTVAASVANAIQTPTFAASSSTTYTDAATLYIAANPTAGTNVTITNGYALWVDSGATRLDGNLIVGTLTSTRIPYASTGGLLVDSASMTFDGSRIALSTTGSSGGLLIGGDANLYRSSADVLSTDDSFTTGGSISAGTNIFAQNGYISTGNGGGGSLGEIRLLGDTSGTVTILPQSSAGTYNFNLPTTAGSAGEVLTSGGGGGSAMTWTAPGALAVRWNSLANPTGSQSLTMSTHTTTWNWATGTSTNNLFNLTTDASANGTGALLRVATGTSSTVVPMLIVAAGTTALTVNASAQVLVNSLTSGRVTFAGTNGLLTDSSSFTYTTGTGQLALATSGSGAGLLLGGDALLYRDAADILRTSDSLRVDVGLGVGAAAPASTGGKVQITGTNTSGTVDFNTAYVTGTHSATGNPVTARIWGLRFVVTQGSSGTYTNTTGATGIEGLAEYTGSTSAEGVTGAVVYARCNTASAVTLVRATGITISMGHQVAIPVGTNGSITNLRPLDISWNTVFNANNQSRCGIRIGAGPTNAGSFSNSIVGGLYFNSDSGGAQDGIIWGISGDTNLYRSAANTLKTDDAFVSGSTITGASSLTLGAAGGTTGSVLLKGTTSGTVTVTVASAAGTWSMTLPTSGGTSGYVLKTDGAGTTSWGNPGIAWTEVTGTSQSASAHAGYLANNAALVTVTLPTPAVGSVIEIVGVGAGGWRAQCASGHTIRMGTTVSASTGYAQSTNQYDCIKIIGISATAWLITSAVGTIDIT